VAPIASGSSPGQGFQAGRDGLPGGQVAAAGSRWRRPPGSATISSITPKRIKSRGDLHVVAASCALVVSCHRIEAAPRRDHAVDRVLPASARGSLSQLQLRPPEPPSPRITADIRTPRVRQAWVERAIASAWPRSSAPMPG